MKIYTEKAGRSFGVSGHFAAMLFVLVVLLVPGKLFSNNLAISNFSVNQGAQTVTFNITWDHSWRIATTPNNWDAAWVFVKFRDCEADANSVQFTQGLVSNVSFSGATAFEASKADGTTGIDAVPNNTGVMIRNSVPAVSGTVSGTVTLTISNMPTSGTIDTRIFGMEMVFVPSGAYFLGDGNGSTGSQYTFTTTSNSSYIPVNITSENALTVYERYCCTIYCPSGNCAVMGGYPKGYNSFYIMKYEVSQQQYTDFLNSLPVSWTAHFPGQNGVNRHTITNTGNPPNQYACTRPDRACNWLSWADAAAYLDWAGLRPLTEFEYEKACRGTNTPNTGEFAWGSTVAVPPAAAGIVGPENGTEVTNTVGANYGGGNTYTTANGGDAGQGPVRCGMFATSATTTRQQTGASFYGAMDLSGNVAEFYISVQAGFSGNVSSSGVSLGDGILDATGSMDVSNWPSVTSTGGLIIRKGGGLGAIAVSDRGDSGNGRDKYSGCRGGR